ncbi:hypothetical protein KP509_33G053000 [Ceratopteris richardii]|uniref:DUF7851 domain-containing protein n=1 Tax=Ceratopteris richardii TaxID=49495 RepID=A0A8T2QQ46_CERRI|nr:hypothetical protein KP509_33G053000 [Ceratopteris richardii]
MDRLEVNEPWGYPTGCSPTAPPAQTFEDCASDLLPEDEDKEFSFASIIGMHVKDASFDKSDHGKVDNFHLHIHCASPTNVREEYGKLVQAGIEGSHRRRGSESQHFSDSRRLSTDSFLHSFSSDSTDNKPRFVPASCAEGLDFGRKRVKAYYRAVKHVDNQRHLITYTMSPSTTQTLATGFTFGLSTKRAKHTIIMFDAAPARHLAHAWPLYIHLYQIEYLIQNLGSAFEYTRSKVKKKHFSLYMYAIKQRRQLFSSEGMQTWADLLYWAHNLDDFTDKTTIANMICSLGSSNVWPV